NSAAPQTPAAHQMGPGKQAAYCTGPIFVGLVALGTFRCVLPEQIVEPVAARRRLLEQVGARPHVEVPASAGGGGAQERGGSRDADVRAGMQPQQTEGSRRFSRQSAIRPGEGGTDGRCIVVVRRG